MKISSALIAQIYRHLESGYPNEACGVMLGLAGNVTEVVPAPNTRTDSALTFLATMQAGDVTLGQLALQSGARSLNWRGAADPKPGNERSPGHPTAVKEGSEDLGRLT